MKTTKIFVHLMILVVLSIVFTSCSAFDNSITLNTNKIGFHIIYDENQILKSRIGDSRLIITGKVLYTKPVEYQRMARNDPEWYWALIKITASLKGTYATRILLMFPNSKQGKWFDAPKFERGHEGIWILKFETYSLDKKTSGKAFTALDPLDFQPLAHIHRIRRFIAE